MKTEKVIIIDVREPSEYEKGHAENSINIPVSKLEANLEKLKNMDGQLVMVCGGGTRNIKAAKILSDLGVACEAGGGWKRVNEKYT